MNKLSYLCKTCSTEKPTKVPRFCDSCYRRLEDDYTKVRIAANSITWPRNLRFCARCAPDYHEAQNLTNEFLGSSPRMVVYRALEWTLAIPLAAMIFPTILALGLPVFAARKLAAAYNGCKT